jgi:hypothetical protein
VDVNSKIKQLSAKNFERKLLNALKRTGFDKSNIQNLEGFATRTPEKGEEYFYYTGPLDDKTRDFCRLMLKIDKVFSKEQIDKIGQELNYDVLKYRGSYNCRHKWVRFRGKIISTPPPTVMEIRKLINRGIEA